MYETGGAEVHLLGNGNAEGDVELTFFSSDPYCYCQDYRSDTALKSC